MKRSVSTFALCIFALILLGQVTYKGVPMIKAKSLKADFRIGNDWLKGWWTISPQISSDSLFITCFSGKEDFVFYTDQDSIHIDLKSQQVFEFYVSVNDTTFALTVIKGIQPNNTALNFDAKKKKCEAQILV